MSVRLAMIAIAAVFSLGACETVPSQPATQAFGPSDPQWREEFRGIELSPTQVEQVRALKVRLDQEAFGEGFNIGDFIAMARRPTGDAEFERGPIAAAIRRYNEGIRQTLTPAQYEIWRRSGGGER